mmetsp:Transcript_36022/g.49124  ORF Transcript_36022/g.49124 Transcript_36022/m.49124 type:complete len:108 (-) Transcript_36022:30-353(-)
MCTGPLLASMRRLAVGPLLGGGTLSEDRLHGSSRWGKYRSLVSRRLSRFWGAEDQFSSCSLLGKGLAAGRDGGERLFELGDISTDSHSTEHANCRLPSQAQHDRMAK